VLSTILGAHNALQTLVSLPYSSPFSTLLASHFWQHHKW